LELLKNYNISPDSSDLYTAFRASQPDNVIDYLLARGLKDNGVGTLKIALSNKRTKYVPQLLAMVDPKYLDDRTTRANYKGDARYWETEYSWTALIYAVQAESFETVKSLVERGANVNLRAEDGATALSLAYDNGLINIYDYLIAQGAREFEPRQVTQAAPTPTQSAPATTIYVQPSTPAPSTPAQPATPTFQTGTYACNRTNITMSLSVGLVIAYSGRDAVGYGTYKISGNQLAVTFDSRTPSTGPGALLRGNTYIYTLTSNSTFSGNGEDWIRTGF
jgi:hypothetical protein